MNQIEFIKKWAVDGDKIFEDSGIYVYHVMEHHVRVLPIKGIWATRLSENRWQSPKIYRLEQEDKESKEEEEKYRRENPHSLRPIKTTQPKGYYIEKWNLIADYADEVKKEEGKDTPLYDVVSNYIYEGKPIGNVILKLTYEMDQRLKALEEKLK